MSSGSGDLGRSTLGLSPLHQREGQETQQGRQKMLPVDGPAQATVFDPRQHSHLTPYLAGLHAQCITRDLMTGSFLPPLANDKLLNYWKDRMAEAKEGTRVIILLLNGVAPAAKLVHGDNLVGVAMLATPHLPSGPFRAQVQHLLVAAKYRRRGGSVTLMNEIHGHAMLKGRTLLEAQTESGSIAEKVFKKMGYVEIGKVPNYSVNASGELKDVVFLYKTLDSASTQTNLSEPS
ncbi:acetyltransferase [Diaporthe helianthi]|uniref:Acetyltransferase n=1 Tax=Diaporthe helianthi TaxID=158607 RepID=A0A2P5IDV9_DIAHE|nr:acetyltransferase [Diaporthe helianthi]